MGRAETEHAVIEHQIDTLREILVTDSRMPEQSIDLIARRACNQTELNTVA